MRLQAFRVLGPDGVREYIAADAIENAHRVYRHLQAGDADFVSVQVSERPFFIGMTVAMTFEGNHRIGWVNEVRIGGEVRVHIASTPTHPAIPLNVREAGVRAIGGGLP